jgi:hypothetical protein
MTTTSTATQKPKKGNGAAKQAAVMAGMDLPPCDESIAVAAYFRAEQRGFAPGDELADWFQAEAECKSSSSQPTA